MAPETAHAVLLPNGYEVSDDRARLDMAHVLACLDTAYWAIGRPHDVTLRSWANCLPFGIYAPGGTQVGLGGGPPGGTQVGSGGGPPGGGTQVGFGRVLTDYAFRAHLGDVFIEPASRGRGLGKALIGHVLAHPALVTVDHWTLTTGDAHGLYERFGFSVAESDGKWMTMNRASP